MRVRNPNLLQWLRIGLFLITVTSAAEAADRPVADQVTLRNGSKLRGVLMEQSDKSLTLLVSAKWLSAANAKLHQAARQHTIAANTTGLEQAVRRLKAEPPPVGNAALAAFLEQQSDAAETALEKADDFDPEFLWLTLSMKEVARIEAASPEHRQLLTWAWTENLDRVETRSAEELSRELKARNVSPIGWPLAFVERLPAREQNDDEWAARRALVEYALGPRLDFQGTGDVLARAGKVAPTEIGELLVELLRQQLQSQFGDLLGEPRPAKNGRDNAAKAESLAKAIQTAESEKRSGFRVTRLEMAGDFQQASVTTQFVARLADGSWRTIFQHTELADAKQARPEIEKRIQDDPQVKKVLDLTRQLGVAADGQIQQAIRFGAATMTAQQSCDREFAAFRDVYLPSLVKPALSIGLGK
ncbi:MAG: hypothetical protein DWI21_00400 [Planctomycetota bacterium]|nr:MAG: hypothetical protein DWI21_00400 [Planctomycetota bacterium]